MNGRTARALRKQAERLTRLHNGSFDKHRHPPGSDRPRYDHSARAAVRYPRGAACPAHGHPAHLPRDEARVRPAQRRRRTMTPDVGSTGSDIVSPMMPSPTHAASPQTPRAPGAVPAGGSGLGIASPDIRRLAASGPDPIVWFLAECPACGEDLGQPFRLEGDRDHWAAEHCANTTHTVHLTVDAPDALPYVDMQAKHLKGIVRIDDQRFYRWLCMAEGCARWHGPYDTARIAVAAWRRHSEGAAK